MAQRLLPLVLLALLAAALPARAQDDDESRFNIMVPEKGAKPAKPEPWLAPTYKSPRGTRQHVVIPKSHPLEPPQVAVPPPLVAPSGQTLPNLPTVAPSGPHGTETYQDRAARCAHQAGVYGPNATGNTNAYIQGCINQ